MRDRVETAISETGGARTTGRSTGHRSRRAFLATGAAAAIGSLVGCLGGGAASPTAEPMPEVLYRHRFKRAGLASAVNDGGVELGTWEQEGLEVEFVTSSGSQATVQSVAQGKDEFGNASVGEVLKHVQTGAPLKIIGQVIDPMSGVVSLKETGITSWTDLEGKVVGQFPWSPSGKLAMEALEKRGGDPSTVELQNVKPGSSLQLLMEGKLDATVRYFPQAAVRLQEQGYETNALPISDVIQNLGVALFTREELLESKPELVNKFVRGWLRAHRKFVTDVDKVIEAHKEHVVEFDGELERKTLGPVYASRVPPKELGTEHGKGWTPKDELQNTQNALHEIGVLDETRPVDGYYTNRFIEQNQELAVDVATTYYEALNERFDVGPNYV